MIAAPRPGARRRRGGRSRPWRRRRRRRSDPRRRRPWRRDAASGRPRPSAGCRRRGARSAASGRSAAGPPARPSSQRGRASRGPARGSEKRLRPAASGLRKRFSRTVRFGMTDSPTRSAQTRLTPARHRLARRARRERRAVEQHPAAGDRRRAPKSARPTSPGRRRAGRRARRPRRHGSRSRPGRHPPSSDRSRTRRGAPSRCGGRRKTCDGSRPTMSRIASSGVVSPTRPLAGDAAVAQHDHAIGDLEDLVEPVRDIDHADAAVAQPAQRREEPRHLVGRQARRRLVEDQDLGLGRERAGDGDQRFLGAAEALDADVGIDVGAERSRARSPRAGGPRSSRPCRAGAG